MDMATTRGGHSRYYDSDIKRREILEPSHVEIGYEFILKLRLLRDQERAKEKADSFGGRRGRLSREEQTARFNRDKNVIAQQMRYNDYFSLPKGAKSFESRCASIQRLRPQMRYEEIARAEKAFNQSMCDKLYDSIMEEFALYTLMHEPELDHRERVHHLMRRMCFYSCRLPATDHA